MLIEAVVLIAVGAKNLEYEFTVPDAYKQEYASYKQGLNEQRIAAFEEELNSDSELAAKWSSFRNLKALGSSLAASIAERFPEYAIATKVVELEIIRGFRVLLANDGNYHFILFTQSSVQIYNHNKLLVESYEFDGYLCRLVDASQHKSMLYFFIVTRDNQVLKLSAKFNTEKRAFTVKVAEEPRGFSDEITHVVYAAPFVYLQTATKTL